MDSIGERIKEVRKSLDMIQEEFGNRLGVTRAAISRLESGGRNITEQMIMSICREFNVSEKWLRTGEGDMFLISDSISLDSHAISCGLSKSDIKVIKKFITLYPSIKDILLEITRNED